MSHQWIPSNGTEGHQFINDWCGKCARDAVSNGQKIFDDCDDSELCPILAAAFRGTAKEWVEHDDGRTECTAFVPLGAAQPQRDDAARQLLRVGLHDRQQDDHDHTQSEAQPRVSARRAAERWRGRVAQLRDGPGSGSRLDQGSECEGAGGWEVNTDQLIAKLDELIAATRSAAIPANMRWLSAESMAAMLDMSPRQFAERLACKPGFPKPAREGHPRWNVAEATARFFVCVV